MSGTEGAARAREYIVADLEKQGIKTVTQTVTYEGGEDADSVEIINVGGVIPGESEDVIVLAAPYDTRHFEDFTFVGANDGGSGPALLLELGAHDRRGPASLHDLAAVPGRRVALDGAADANPPRVSR